MKISTFHSEFRKPYIMAILNVTPDSFYDGGLFYGKNNDIELDLVLKKVDELIKSGADIIDVGGESTRPGAIPVPIQEELDRVVPVVETIVDRFGAIVSVDTSCPEVINESANAGADMINDVRALTRLGAVEAVAKSGLNVCLMHMSGEPKNMQLKPSYIDVVAEVSGFLLDRISVCESAGIQRNKILIDPGFGFGKNLEHNLMIFRNLTKLSALGFPIVVGLSRKSMIGSILNKATDDRLFGSIAMAMLAVQKGAQILRVHDVSATADVLKIMSATE
ncbi:MAG: dihydropteroate synthase [Porticoccus sp.]|jgi:dihydropteroate synthase|nr:dihydropteroate synthase [Porticoccus sp.]MAD58116.1 dihydropteroate synthase [Porticoccus sp.]